MPEKWPVTYFLRKHVAAFSVLPTQNLLKSTARHSTKQAFRFWDCVFASIPHASEYICSRTLASTHNAGSETASRITYAIIELCRGEKKHESKEAAHNS